MGTKGKEIVKLDVENVLILLNKAFADEWLAYYQYWVGAQVAKGPMRGAVVAELNEHAEDELKHAGMLATRIIQLGGTPVLDPADWRTLSNCGYDAPANPHVQAIVEQMAFYQTPISQATVVVTEFHSQQVVVTGQVLSPATHYYEKIPDLWRIILDSGGPSELADLSKVSIIRKGVTASQIINVDLLNLIQKGDLSKAPEIISGDLINVPSSAFGAVVQLGERTKFEGRNIYYVLGSVAQPGVRTLDAGIDVLDAIAIAGGFTTDADLKNVRVIMKGPRYSVTTRFNT